MVTGILGRGTTQVSYFITAKLFGFEVRQFFFLQRTSTSPAMPNAMLKAAKKTLWPHYTTHLPVKKDVLLCFVEILSTFLASLDNLSPWFIPCFFSLVTNQQKKSLLKSTQKVQKLFTQTNSDRNPNPQTSKFTSHPSQSASKKSSKKIDLAAFTTNPHSQIGSRFSHRTPTDASALLHPSAAELGPPRGCRECRIHEPRIPRLEFLHFFLWKKGVFWEGNDWFISHENFRMPEPEAISSSWNLMESPTKDFPFFFCETIWLEKFLTTWQPPLMEGLSFLGSPGRILDFSPEN